MKYTLQEQLKIMQLVEEMIERSKLCDNWSPELQKTWNSYKARVARNIGMDENEMVLQ